MKPTKRIKSGVKLTCPQRGCSFQPLPSVNDSARQDNGKNDYSAEFAAITTLILSQFGSRTFSVNDAFQLSGGLSIPPGVVKAKWTDWTRRMLASGRIKRIESCMDDEMFVM